MYTASMNLFSTKKYLILATLSLVLSLVIIRWHSVGNVSFCINSAGCRFEDPKGTITVRTYGFPLAYKQTTSFRPNNSNDKAANYAGYAETSIESQSFSIPSVIVSALFWFGLLNLAARFIKPKKPVIPELAPEESPNESLRQSPKI